MAVVGASERPDSLRLADGHRGAAQPRRRAVHLVNPGRDDGARPARASRRWPTCRSRSTWCCSASPTTRCVDQVRLASRRGATRGAVVFGAGARPARRARGRRGRRAGDRAAAAAWGSSTSSAGCARSATSSATRCRPGRSRWSPTPGSVFSALLRTHRRLGVLPRRLLGPGAGHHDRRLPRPTRSRLPETRVVGLVLETLRDAGRAARPRWPRRRRADVPVVALTVGTSPRGRPLVDAHSGALAGSRRGAGRRCSRRTACTGSTTSTSWPTRLELLRDRPAGPAGGPAGIATVHDSGAERVLAADVAERARRPVRAAVGRRPRERLAGLLDPGSSRPTRWTSGAPAPTPRTCSPSCLAALADDPSGRRGRARGRPGPGVRRRRVVPAGARPAGRPHRQAGRGAVATSPSAIDQPLAAGLRGARHPGARGHPVRPAGAAATCSTTRRRPARAGTRRSTRSGGRAGRRRLARRRGRRRSRCSPTTAIPVRDHRGGRRPGGGGRGGRRARLPGRAQDRRPGVHHKLDVDGVRLGLGGPRRRRRGVRRPRRPARAAVSVQPQVPPGVELAARHRARPAARARSSLVAAGGSLVELLGERAVALPPVDAGDRRRAARPAAASRRCSAGHRGRPRRSTPTAVVAAVVGVLAARARARRPARGARRQPAGRRRPAASVAVDALRAASSRRVRGARGGLSVGADSGNGSAIGSGASRLRPCSSNRSSPRSVTSTTSVAPRDGEVGGGLRDAGPPHHPVAAGGGDDGAGDRAVGGEHRPEDRQVVGREVDGGRPRLAQPEVGGDRQQRRPSGRAPGRSRPSRTPWPRPAARRGCSSPTARRPPRAASRCRTPRRRPSAAAPAPGRGAASVTTTWWRAPPAGIRTPAARPTAARVGPPVSTTRSVAISPR